MFISKYSVTGAIFFLFVSGCGGGGKDSSAPTGSSLSPSYSIIGNISGMNDIRSIELALGSEILLISQNGSFSFTQRFKKGAEYEIEIERKPARQDCQINNASGVVGDMNVSDIEVVCLWPRGRLCMSEGYAAIFAPKYLTITLTAFTYE